MIAEQAVEIAMAAARSASLVAYLREDHEGIRINFSEDKLRLMAATIRKHRGGFSSEQTTAFLTLYGEELRDYLNQAVRDFIQKKVG